jgi:hypothetical protein
MPVTFADDGKERFDAFLARNLHDDDDDDSTERGEENTLDIGSVGTASEYVKNIKDAPDRMLFGNLECLAIFELALVGTNTLNQML